MFYRKVFSSLSIMFQLKSATVSSKSLPAFISTRNLKCSSVKNTSVFGTTCFMSVFLGSFSLLSCMEWRVNKRVTFVATACKCTSF